MKTVFRFKQAEDQINKFFSSLESELFNSVWNDPGFMQTRNWRPERIINKDQSRIIEIELPRFEKKDIKVTKVDCWELKVEAKRDGYSFEKNYLIYDCQLDKADIKLENGVLYIELPKEEKAKQKLLEIK